MVGEASSCCVGLPSGADVELMVIHGAGHAWPVVPIDAASAIWDFFSRQTAA